MKRGPGPVPSWTWIRAPAPLAYVLVGQCRDGCVVVRLVGDFLNDLGVQDRTVFVQDDDRAGQQALHRAIAHG